MRYDDLTQKDLKGVFQIPGVGGGQEGGHKGLYVSKEVVRGMFISIFLVPLGYLSGVIQTPDLILRIRS